RLVLVDERDARPEVLHVETEVESRGRNAVEAREVEAERRADAGLAARRELDADVLERSADREVGQDLRAVVDRRGELVRAEVAGEVALLVGPFTLAVREEHQADAERAPTFERLHVIRVVVADVVREPG